MRRASSKGISIWTTLNVGNHRHEIPQNISLHDADDSTTFVALQFGILARHLHYNAATAINAGRFVSKDWESCFETAHTSIVSSNYRPPQSKSKKPAEGLAHYGLDLGMDVLRRLPLC